MNTEDRKYAEDLDAVRRAYRGAARDNDDMMPPAAIDDAIRAAARRAVQAGPQPTGNNWLGRWTPQLAVAAVVVLSVSVVLLSVEERPELAPAAVQKITLPRQSEQPAASIVGAPPANISAGKLEMRAQDMAAPSKPAEPVRTRILDQNIASASKSGFAFAPPPEVQISALPLERAKKEDRGSAEMDRTVRLPEVKRLVEKSTLAGATSSRDTVATAPAAAGANAVPAPTVVASALSAPAPGAPGAPAPGAPTPGAVTPLPKLKQPSTAELQRAETDESRRDQAQAAAVGIRGIGNEQFAATDALAKDSRPGPWLKRMLELRDKHKLKELREELARFRKAHPNVVLPKELAAVADSRE